MGVKNIKCKKGNDRFIYMLINKLDGEGLYPHGYDKTPFYLQATVPASLTALRSIGYQRTQQF